MPARLQVLPGVGVPGLQPGLLLQHVAVAAGRLLRRRIAVPDERHVLDRRGIAGFGKGARHFESPGALIEALQDCMHADMTVLVKGSRGVGLDLVVDGLLAGGH